MVIDKVFEQLKQQDRTLTKKKFSSDYLGKSESYLKVIKHRGTQISTDALLTCYVKLKNTKTLSDDAYHNKVLAQMLLEEIEHSVCDGVSANEIT